MSNTCGLSSKVLPSSMAQMTACATPVPISIFRRSTWSASAPPYRPNTTSGAIVTRPIAPTAKFEWVNWYS